MKKSVILLVVILTLLLVNASITKAQTCYYYITQQAGDDFPVYKGESLKIIITNIFTADCDEIEQSITLEYGEALKAKYPQSYYKTSQDEILWEFDTREAALKDKRKEVGEYKSEGWKIINFSFTYYGD